MQNLNFATRISLGFGLLLLLMIGLCSVGYWGVSSQAATVDRLIATDIALNLDINGVRHLAGNLRRYEKDSILNNGNTAKLEEYLKKWKESHVQAVAYLDSAHQLDIPPQTRSAIATLQQQMQRYGEGYQAFHTELAAGKFPDIAAAYQGSDAFRNHIRAMEGSLTELHKQTEAAAKQARAQVAQVRAATIERLLWLAGLALLIGIVIAWQVAVSIRRPLTEAQKAAERIARHNDLTTKLPDCGRNEVGSTLQAFRTMLDSMQQLILSARQDASLVAESANSLADIADQVSTASSRQSEAASATAAAIQELTSSLQVVSENTDAVRASAEQTDRNAAQGSQLANGATDEISRIAETLDHATTVIDSLNARSGEIDGIVRAIKEIADQTNLLALNAAIEAARAGESGRGFAVVADEVRKLAERTTLATTDISTKIEAVQRDTREAFRSMSETRTMIERGVEATREVAVALSAIRATSNNTASRLNEVSTALREQGIAADSIASNIERVAQMSEENHASVASATDVSRYLNQLAQTLAGQIQRFVV
ncbi:methyl-accepting chemotaxis protein [Chitinimonas lacunae]|uniref:Methyl-accepting chemotaxis protein n=1 Tax=Chitinimonas lacunae TaxID=1963018 RepID=A0ABV8MJ23_9NEIS